MTFFLRLIADSNFICFFAGAGNGTKNLQTKNGFVELLQSHHIAVNPKVMDKIVSSFAPRLILCVEFEDAFSLYDEVQRMPQTTVLGILRENRVYLNGVFLTNPKTTIINALENGKPKMFKIPKNQHEAEHEAAVWKRLIDDTRVDQKHLVPLTMVLLNTPEMLKTEVAGEVEVQPVRFGLMMPKYACVTTSFKGVDIQTVVKWVAETLEAIAQFHIAGMMHGDVKPDNIFLDQDGVVKLGDYGAAVNVVDGKFKEYSTAYIPCDIYEPCYEVDHYCLALSALELCNLYVPTFGTFKSKSQIKEMTATLPTELFVMFENLLI